MTLSKILIDAVEQGHQPGIYRRGNQWRVHLDVATNTWDNLDNLALVEIWLREKMKLAETEDLP